MKNCGLTRGAFYAHFKSKSALYSEALSYATTSSELSKIKPEETSDREWLGLLLDAYLSIEHVNGHKPCPLAFLATDIVLRDSTAKQAYARAFENMNKAILIYAGPKTNCTEQDILALTSMIIGAVAVARSLDNEKQVHNTLRACRQQARTMLRGI